MTVRPILSFTSGIYLLLLSTNQITTDAAQQQAEADMSEGEINDEESPQHETNDAVSNALTAKSNEIDDLVQEVTENETTAAGLVLESILASGLNEQALNKRKEKIHRL